jgi:MFS family permease
VLGRPALPRDGEYRPDPDRWKALGVVLAAGFMTLLDVSIVNVALPSIEQGLHAQPNALEWIVAGYALALGLLLVPAGRFGDAHGRRPVFMVGVAVFVVASALCALARTPLELVLMRVVQGFAGGLISPQISGLIQSLFRGEERGKAFGWFGSTIGVSTAIGPLTGGALIALFGAHDGWRAVFFVNLPIGAAILLLARRYLPAPTAAEHRRQSLDSLGVLLLGAAVVCILVPFIEQRAWHGPLRLALFPLAAVLLVVWVLHERRYGRTASRSCRSTCSGSAPTCSALRWASCTSPGSSRCSSSSPSTCSSAWTTPRGSPAWPPRRSPSAARWSRPRAAARYCAAAPSSWPSGSPRSSSGWPASGWRSAPIPATTSQCGRRCRC